MRAPTVRETLTNVNLSALTGWIPEFISFTRQVNPVAGVEAFAEY